MACLGDEGIVVPTLAEEIATLEAAQKEVFQDIVLDPSSPDKQLNGLFAERLVTAYEVMVKIYNGLDPRTASGIMLDRVAAINAVNRLKASPATATVTITGDSGSLAPAGMLFSTESGRVFRLVTSVTVSTSGTVTGYTEETTYGGSGILVDTLTQIDTPVSGITSVNNDDYGQAGRDAETDQELRERRQKSLGIGSKTMLDSTYAAILAVDGVEDVKVYENSRDDTDEDLIPAHSIYPVVLGGDSYEIASAIMQTKSLGVGLFGTTHVTYYDTQDFAHTVLFKRPDYKDIYLQITVSTTTFGQGTIDDVRTRILQFIDDVRDGTQECAAGSLGIGDDVYAAVFYAPIINQNEYSVLEVLIGSTSAVNSTHIPIDIAEISSFDRDHISVISS